MLYLIMGCGVCEFSQKLRHIVGRLQRRIQQSLPRRLNCSLRHAAADSRDETPKLHFYQVSTLCFCCALPPHGCMLGCSPEGRTPVNVITQASQDTYRGLDSFSLAMHRSGACQHETSSEAAADGFRKLAKSDVDHPATDAGLS